MLKVQFELDNMKKAIRFLLFAEIDDDDKMFIIDRLNQIFDSHLTLSSGITDLPWNDPTISQIDQMQGLIEDLQERNVLSCLDPCKYCGKYFMLDEDIVKLGEDETCCMKCFEKHFDDEKWTRYTIKANLGFSVDDHQPVDKLLDMLTPETREQLSADVCEDMNAVAYKTTAD